ncbi:MAG TPA: hypothetical protein VFB73_09335 [Chloroflexota bacterium]|nr:hypothetical protein [Chloroflexota bacterium]
MRRLPAVPLVRAALAGAAARPALALWLAVFAYAALAALAVQLLLLPHLFPRWHAGHGLLVGGDWLAYHDLAAELAAALRAQGWAAWQLRPEGHSVAGLAAIVYALTVPEPWTLIPLNAALHATAAVVLFRLVQVLVPRSRLALWGVLPFVLYPSAMAWYAQLLKDGYAVLGYLLFLYGWVRLLQPATWDAGARRNASASAARVAQPRCACLRGVALALLWLFSGAALTWLARPPAVQLLQLVGGGLALLATGVFLGRARRAAWPWGRALAAAAVAWAALALLTPLTREGPTVVEARAAALGETAPPPRSAPQELPALLRALPLPGGGGAAPAPGAGPAEAAPEVAGPVPLLAGAREALAAASALGEAAAVTTGVLAERALALVDAKVYALGVVRDGYRTSYPDAASNIDLDITLRSLGDVLAYLPRAAVIAFLAPFPPDWFAPGHLEASALMRRLAGAEMVGVYLALGGLLYACWRWRARVELHAIVLFCSGMMLAYALLITNVGALHRLRYGFLMTLVAVGVVAGLTAWEERRARAAPPAPLGSNPAAPARLPAPEGGRVEP